MIPAFDILVAGELNPDLVLSGNVIPAFDDIDDLVGSASLTIGSASARFACAAARLGLKVTFAGVCGGDIFGSFMLDELSQRGVDVSGVSIDPLLQTGLRVIFNRPSAAASGKLASLTYLGAINCLRAEQVTSNCLAQARHLHIASYFLQTAIQPGLPDLFQRAHALGLTTSLTPGRARSGVLPDFGELLGQVDVFLPNENEALVISGFPAVEAAAGALARQCGLVIVKLDAGGALACRTQQVTRAERLPVPVVDTVGAGDAFDAGFLNGFLKGWGLEDNLALAAACGALSTRAAGGITAQPTLDEARQYILSVG